MMAAPHRPDRAVELRRVLVDPVRLCAELGILGGKREHQRQARGVLVRCPMHGDRSPSLSVRVAEDGTIGAKCFGCGWSGDALALVGAVRGLSDFADVLDECARVAGRPDLMRDVPEGRPVVARPAPLPPPEPLPPREYPPVEEVAALWRACGLVTEDAEAAAYLAGRSLPPDKVEDLDLARVLRPSTPLPRWARQQGATWRESGHRVVLPVYDERGALRSVRAWRVTEGESPKRLPPSGHRGAGLVLACPLGRGMLERGEVPGWWPEGEPFRVIIAEGEPDFLTWATRWGDAADTAPAVLGLVKGAWSPEIAARIPDGARVIIRTDNDKAGDRYAEQVAETLTGRCELRRARPGGEA